MICDKCNFVIKNRKNIYGTRCPECHNLIAPIKEPEFVIENREKEKLLKEKVLRKIKEV